MNKLARTAIAIASVVATTGAFSAEMTRADYSAAKTRISADYKADKASCDASKDNARDICNEKATSKERIAFAELEYAHTGNAADSGKIAVATADGAFAVAKEVCDDRAGDAKDLCRAEAKAAHTKAIADTKLVKAVGEARTDAIDDKRDAQYKLDSEKCSSLAGDAKDACSVDAKARAGKR